MTLRILMSCVLLGLIPHTAAAHDAPSGWRYDASCCSGIDCRQISSASLKERPDGYFITIGNEVVPYNDRRIHDSPDGYVHWCTIGGRDNGRTICLYVPPRGF
ncbi:hypothetical protein [Pararhizobium sp. O133]|uniref:hypothetical protein n=1 Tax=Pararhizobium sp. O133 TaxID=3449278 RepID=UPI003F68397B